MIRAYKLYTGADGHSHFTQGTIKEKLSTQALSIHFKETPPHSEYDWHPAPNTQYVMSLTGTLEFTTSLGETFILKPGDVLLATDTTGHGHKWKMLGEDPWKRVYVVFTQDMDVNFIPD
ncbi:cupin domain-containing protein [Rufibacter hautae]|uniref:Cupin domain-containing protein n=1 Tax=Rufibacter hautae TaxID=2595005 RepID=A0A5B6TDB2_9BACT|nr:hypothetical protein [Rufibacter hautae]KAA3438148.1 hypothetical protein FOA19_12855 [Rufibacter hautae]